MLSQACGLIERILTHQVEVIGYGFDVLLEFDGIKCLEIVFAYLKIEHKSLENVIFCQTVHRFQVTDVAFAKITKQKAFKSWYWIREKELKKAS